MSRRQKRKSCFVDAHCAYDCPNFAVDEFEDRYDLPASDAGLVRIKCKDCYHESGLCTDCLFQNSKDCPEFEGGDLSATD